MHPVATLLVVDDHILYRRALRRYLEEQDWLQVVGEAVDGVEAIALTEQLQPAVVLMDIEMPRLNGLEACRAIKQSNPTIKVILYTLGEPVPLEAARLVQAEECIAKDQLFERLGPSLRAIFALQR